MKKIKPYRNLDEAIAALDNGGRFYNLFTKARDGIISQAELGRLGGVFNDAQELVLMLELYIIELNQNEKQKVISKLDDKLLTNFNKYKSQIMLPSEANLKAKVASSIVIKGIPK